MSRDTQTLRDIWNAAQEILEFTAGLDWEALLILGMREALYARNFVSIHTPFQDRP
jgi:hypothetical protein